MQPGDVIITNGTSFGVNIVNPYQLPNLIDNLTAVKEF